MAKKHKINRFTLLNAKITSIVSVTLVLLLMGLTVLTFFLGKGISSYVKENMSFSVMLTEDVSESEINSLRKRLDSMPFVKSSLFISKEKAKEQLIKWQQEVKLKCNDNHISTELFELYNMITVGNLIVQQSIERKGNRGGFVKLDPIFENLKNL